MNVQPTVANVTIAAAAAATATTTIKPNLKKRKRDDITFFPSNNGSNIEKEEEAKALKPKHKKLKTRDATKCPHKIKVVYDEILKHPKYPELKSGTRFAFEHACVRNMSWCTKQNNAWSRKIWHHLYLGEPLD
jgi:hypothetical protein